MASDVDSKQNEATCSNKALEVFLNVKRYINPRFTYLLYLLKAKPKYKPVSGRLWEHFGLTYFQRHKAHNTL